MANFLAELKRRSIFRVGAAYAVVAWAALQLVNNLQPALRLPDWTSSLVVVLLLVGFPVALIFAWVHDAASSDVSLARTSHGKLDWFLAAALVVVIVLVSYAQFAPSQNRRTQQAGVDAARAASLTQVGAISVAVLPFSNLSSDAEQEFFSDGMTEEITAALAKISDLRVVARTSAFQFKGANKDMRAVGQALGATHLIEGSVRKAGTRVRITAQLIKTDDGTHIWSENYDRELIDVFAIQEDIATAIAGALRMPLGLKPGERLVSSRTIGAEDYAQYLRAKPLVRARRMGVPEAIKILEPVVARSPDYAPAWAQLSEAYGLTLNYHRDSVDEVRRTVDAFRPKAEAAALKAIQLDPNLADGYWTLASVEKGRGKFLRAEELFSKALALDPNNPDALSRYSNLLENVGRLKEALAMKQQVRALEPYAPGFTYDEAEVLWLNGQDDDAIALLKQLGAGNAPPGTLARIFASLGRYGEAADYLEAVFSLDPNRIPNKRWVEATRLLRMAPVESASSQTFPNLGVLGFIYLYIGNPVRALESYEVAADGGYFAASGGDDALLWHPSYAAVRKTERYKAFIRKSGYVEYWRAKGWPELCHPTTADDFVCE